MIPKDNIRNLLLRQDVVEAVKAGNFHVYAVSTIDEGIEVLTGVPAGTADENGVYPENTVHHNVVQNLRDMAEKLPRGIMLLFPEGTRSRKGGVRPGRAGAGVVALTTKARVIPVAVEGMQHVLPIGKALPRIGKRIFISYGEPVDLSDLFEKERNRETSQLVVDRVMDRIRSQHAELVSR